MVSPLLFNLDFSTWKGEGLLTPKHLVLIRAALQYFEEEMGPHWADVCGDDLEDDSITIDELRDLQKFLSIVEIRYARLKLDRTELADTTLMLDVMGSDLPSVTILLPLLGRDS